MEKIKEQNYLIAYAFDEKPAYRPWPQADKLKVKSFKMKSRFQPTVAGILTGLKVGWKNSRNLRVLSITHIKDRIHNPVDKKLINMEKTNLNLPKVNLGYHELVDTAADIVEFAMDIVKAGEDGWQLTDSFVLISNAGKIEEIIKDGPQAIAELKDLNEVEAGLAANELSQRLNADSGTILEKVDQAFNLISRAYILIADIIHYGKSLKPI